MMTRTFLSTLHDGGMLREGDRVLLAVSGGPDSVAMAHLFCEIRASMKLALFMAHVNHGLRSREADEDEAFVRELSKSMEMPLEVKRLDPALRETRKGSMEELFRQARYAFFDQLAGEKRLDKIATGHTRNDQAETFLLRLFRGAGLEGLASIQPVRQDKIIRPLIHHSREDVLAYLAEHRHAFRSDSSNLDLAIPRNRIRHELIPLLEKAYNENIVDVLARTARILREEHEAVSRDTARDLRDALFIEEGKQFLNRGNLRGYPPAAARRIIRAWIRSVKGDLRKVSFDHIEGIARLIHQQTGRKALSLPDSWDFIMENDRLALEPRSPREPLEYAYPVEAPAEINIPEAESKFCLKYLNGFDYHNDIASVRNISYNIGYLDANSTGGKFTIRNRRPGDRFFPLGSGGEKKLKDFFIDKKIPIPLRDKLPLVLKGRDIIWAPGCGPHHRYRVTPRTVRVLTIERTER